MKFLMCVLISSLGLTLFASSAQARQNADMFDDKNLTGKRPWVLSDGIRGADMFKSVPVHFNRNADMFKKIKPNPANMCSEMLHARRRAMPSSPIFTNDHWTN